MIYKLTILPDKKEITVNKSTSLFEAIAKTGITLNSSCAGKGTCGSCKVIVISGKHDTAASSWITADEKKKGYVLACQTFARGDITVEIPDETRTQEIQSETAGARPETLQQPKDIPREQSFPFSPLARKIHLKLPSPNLQDNIPDFERIKRGLENKVEGTHKSIKLNLALLRNISRFLRNADWNLTFSIVEHDNELEIIQVEKGDTSKNAYGIALDIGTTTVAASLISLSNGRVVDSKVTYNRQISFGDDVITRIIYAEEGKGLEILTHSVCETINTLIRSLIEENRILRKDIIALQVAGNTTMIHLFLGIQPDYIRREPYVPVVNFPPSVRVRETGIEINPDGIIDCVPGVASYIGGDITAGVVACGMHKSSDVSLLIDLGTNGEIALGNNEWIVAASCSAGPAFEGVGIKSGIRAIEGAIQRIDLTDDGKKLKYSTIGDKKPKGICGSGLISIPGELLKRNIIDRAGKFVKESRSPFIRQNDEGEIEFVVAKAGDSANGKDIVITETDISNLIRSKGAIFLGMQVLLEEMSFGFKDIKRIYISGGFGTYIDVEKSILIGLLPDLPKERFVFIGNSSITGAKMCLLSKDARELANEIAGKMTCIELSVNPKFMNEYTSTLFLPHTNIDLFPSVKKILEGSSK